jgi:transposase
VTPRHVRDFARATGHLAKTAALDAPILAQFAEVGRLGGRPLPDASTQQLAALLTRRRQRVEMLTAEHNRRGSARRVMRPPIQPPIEWLPQPLAQLDQELPPAGQAARSGGNMTSGCSASPALASSSRGLDWRSYRRWGP